MANDRLFFRALAPLSRRTSVPVRALFAQAAWTTVLVLSGSFDTLTDYAIFAILLFWGMATASVFIVRRRRHTFRANIARSDIPSFRPCSCS